MDMMEIESKLLSPSETIVECFDFSVESPYSLKRKRINQELNYPKTKKQKNTEEFMIVLDKSNVGHVMGIEALIELENPGDVEAVPDGSSFLKLPAEIHPIMADNPLVYYLQGREFAEDNVNDFKIETTILLDLQVEHVVEIDVITESDMISEIHVDVNVNERQLGFMESALDGDFPFDPRIEGYNRSGGIF
ncbi:hypothetical protein LIER_05004 [Lithospermum erythrorhizon]|uniref:Uncharacterized protein n=1 Tax=Lithospermum erythrorhizon TaxID=34254 RepID=A0AAV3NZ50_LITER